MESLIKYLVVVSLLALPATVHAQDIPGQLPQFKAIKTPQVSDQILKLLRTEISLSVKNASSYDVERKILTAVSQGKSFTSRRGLPVQLTFDLEKVRFGDALFSLANLTGSKFYVVKDILLITPEDQLLPQEKADAIEYPYILPLLLEPVQAAKVTNTTAPIADPGKTPQDFGRLLWENASDLLAQYPDGKPVLLRELDPGKYEALLYLSRVWVKNSDGPTITLPFPNDDTAISFQPATKGRIRVSVDFVGHNAHSDFVVFPTKSAAPAKDIS